ncbi:MAG: hypothetical protein KKC55_14905 [Gammaproteobacteria bacterium]|nr:hypothetical protein [Gammaproteobacteria bacterium]
MTEHNHDDIYEDLNRLSNRIEDVRKAINYILEQERSKLQSDIYRLESDIRNLENKISDLERGY